MGSKIDDLLKVTVIASLLIASCSVAYYYLIYVPRRDAKIDLDAKYEKARLEITRQAERDRAVSAANAEKERIRLEQERLDQIKLEAQAKYEECKANAYSVYSSGWARSCKRLGDLATKDRSECLAGKTGLPREYCDKTYPLGDSSSTCSLPTTIATGHQTSLEKARDRCLQESRSGLN